jgi:hypothetical protein
MSPGVRAWTPTATRRELLGLLARLGQFALGVASCSTACSDRAGLDHESTATLDVMSTERLDELRRRLAEQTEQGSATDRVTTVRLARMRRRLGELAHISENSTCEAAMSVEEEAHEIMDSLENVRDLRPDG